MHTRFLLVLFFFITPICPFVSMQWVDQLGTQTQLSISFQDFLKKAGDHIAYTTSSAEDGTMTYHIKENEASLLVNEKMHLFSKELIIVRLEYPKHQADQQSAMFHLDSILTIENIAFHIRKGDPFIELTDEGSLSLKGDASVKISFN